MLAGKLFSYNTCYGEFCIVLDWFDPFIKRIITQLVIRYKPLNIKVLGNVDVASHKQFVNYY